MSMTARRGVAFLTALSFLGQSSVALAQITKSAAGGGQKPFVVSAGNGVPIVNIVTANAAGVSHNKYDAFNVGGEGAVLNNSYQTTDTALAGRIAANPYVRYPARMIINEVQGSSGSRLAGALEVAGGSAELIIANPNGITCSGCGFLNTPAVTLTTGVPHLATDGTPRGFAVTQGTLVVEGNGLDASNLDQVNLLARSLVVNAGIWAKSLSVGGGAAFTDAVTGAGTPIAGQGGAPAYWLDVGTLGGMYANRIRLVGTEAGLGVNSRGTIAALTEGVQLTSQGKIDVGGTISAPQDIDIASTDGIAISGKLVGRGKVTAAAGQVEVGGLISARGDISLAGQRINVAGTVASGTDDDGKIATASTVTLDGTSVAVTGALLAGARVAVGGGAISAPGATLAAVGEIGVSSAGDVDLTGARLDSPQIALAGASVSLRDASVVASGGTGLSVVAGGAVDTAGGVLSSTSGPVVITAGSLDNRGGRIASDLGNVRVDATGGVDNRGGLIGGNGDILLRGGNVDNTGGRIQAGGQADIRPAGSLVNGSQGQITASAVTLRSGAISNGGSIGATGGIDLRVDGVADNVGGSIEAGQSLAFAAGSLVNDQGRLVNAGTGSTRIDVADAATNRHGLIGGNGQVRFAAASLDNESGTLVAQDALTTTVRGKVGNRTGLIAGSTTELGMGSLDNSGGRISISGSLSAAVDGRLDNHGGSVEAASTKIVAGSLDNSGRIFSLGLLQLTAGSMKNGGGQLLGGGDVQFSATSLDNSSGEIAAGALLSADISTLFNNRGGLVEAQSFDVTAADAINAGGILRGLGGASRLTVGGTLDNAGGGIAANGSLAVVAETIDNSTSNGKSGVIQSRGAMQIGSAAGLNNAGGQLLSDGNLDLAVASLGNGGGQIASGGTLSGVIAGAAENRGGLIEAQKLELGAGSLDNAGGRIASLGSGAASLAVAGVLNNGGGTIGGNGSIAVTAGSLVNGTQSGQGGLIQAQEMSIATLGDLGNVGGTLLARNLSASVGGSLDNRGGVAAASGNATFRIGDQFDNRSGLLQAGGTLDIAVPKFQSFGGTLAATNLALTTDNFTTMGSSLAVSGNLRLTIADTLDNRAYVLGAANIDISAATLRNEGGRIESPGFLSIATTTLNNDSGGIVATGSQTLAVNAAGTLDNSSGIIGGNGDVQLRAGNLANAGGTVQAVGNLSVAATGRIDNLSGGQVVSGGRLDLTADSMSNIGGRIVSNGALSGTITHTADNRGGTIEADSLALTAESITNQGGRIQAQEGFGVSTAGNLDNAGGMLLARNLSLTAGGALNNANGYIQGQSVQAQAGSLDNRAGQVLSLGSGPVQIQVAGNIDNGGGFVGGNGDVRLQAGNLSNTAGMVQAVGSLGVVATGRVDNLSGGKLLSGGPLELTADSLSNAGGQIVSAGALSGAIANAVDNRNGMIEAQTLALTAGSLTNAGGRIASLGTGAASLGVAGVLDNDGGSIGGNGDLGVTAGSLSNTALSGQVGQIQAQNGLSIVTASDLGNVGGALLAESVSLTVGGALNNANGYVQGQNVQLQAAASLDNRAGQVLSLGSGQMLIQAAGNIDNGGGFVGGNGDVHLLGGSLSNAGGVTQAVGSLAIATTGQIDNLSGGRLTAGAGLTLTADAFDNSGGSTSADRIDIAVAALTNRQGVIAQSGTGATTIGVTGTLDNRSGRIVSNGSDVSIAAGSIANGAGRIEHAGSGTLDMAATAGIDNGNGIVASLGNVRLAGSLLDNRSGVIQAGQALTTGSLGALDNRGGVLSATDVAIVVNGSLDNRTGKIQGTDAVTLSGVDLANRGGRIVGTGNGATVRLQTTGDTDNSGGLIASNADVVLAAGRDAINVGGTIQAVRDVTVNASRDLANEADAATAVAARILAGRTLTTTSTALRNDGGTVGASRLDLTAQSVTNRGGTLSHTGLADLELDFATLDNSLGTIAANAGNLTVSGGVFANAGGRIEHAGTGTFRIAPGSGVVDNTGGALVSAGTLSVDAARVDNAGGLLQGNAALITGSGLQTLDNRGGRLIGAGSATLAATAVDNSSGGLIQSGGALTMTVASLDNRGGKVIGLGAGASSVTVTGTLDNRAGLLGGNGRLTVNANALDNTAGNIKSVDSLSLSVTGNLTNAQGGSVAAGGVLSVAGGAIDNRGGELDGHGLAVNAATLDNRGGVIQSAGSAAVGIVVQGQLDNRNGRVIVDATNASVQAGSFANAGGRLEHGGAGVLTVRQGGTTLDNGYGFVGTAGQLDLAASVLANVGGTLQASQGFRFAGSLTSIDNRQGLLLSGGNLSLALAQDLANGSGRVVANGVLSVSAGNVANAGGELSGYAVSLNAATLGNQGGIIQSAGGADAAIIVQGQFDNSGGRVAINGGNATVQAGSLANAGGRIDHGGGGVLTLWQAGTTLDNGYGFVGTAGRLDLTAGALGNFGGTLQAAQGFNFAGIASIDNRQGRIVSGRDLSLSLAQDLANDGGSMEAAGAFSLAARNIANAGGRIVAAGSGAATVTATGTLDNRAGTIGGNGALQVRAATLDNRTGLVQAGGGLGVNVTSLLNAAGTVTSNAAANIVAQSIDNTGGKLGGASLTLSAATVDNRGGLIFSSGSGDASVSVGNSLDNSQGGRISFAGTNALVSAAQLINRSGQIAHGGTGSLTVSSSGAGLDNTGGTIASAGDVSVSASRLDNAGGIVSGTRSLTLSSPTINNNARGRLYGGTLTLNATTLNNAGGEIGSHSGATLAAAAIDNTGGKIVNDGSGTLTITTSSLANADGKVQSAANLSLVHNGTLTNYYGGELFAGGQLNLTVNGGDLVNRGRIAAAGSADFAVAGTIDNDWGTIAANGTLRLQGSVLTNRVGTISNAGTGDTQLTMTNAIINDGGTIIANGRITVNTVGMENVGGILQGGQVDIAAAALNNTGGTLRSTGNLGISSTHFVNDNGTTAASAGSISVTAIDFSNYGGRLNAGGSVTLAVTRIASEVYGDISSGGDTTMTIAGSDSYGAAGLPLAHVAGWLNLVFAGDFVNTGTLAKQNFRVQAANIWNSGTLSGDNLDLQARGSFGNTGSVSAYGNLAISAQGDISNTGSLTGANVALNAVGNVWNNGSALIGAAGNLNLTAGGGVSNTGGANIYAGNGLAVSAAGLLNEYSAIQSGGNMSLVLGSYGLTNRAGAPTVVDTVSAPYGVAAYEVNDSAWGIPPGTWYPFTQYFEDIPPYTNYGPFTGEYAALGGFTLIAYPADAPGCTRAAGASKQDIIRTVVSGGGTSVIAAGGNLSYSVAGSVWNEYGDILAGGALGGGIGGSLTNLGVEAYNKTRTTKTYWVCTDIAGGVPGDLGYCRSGWVPVTNVNETLNSTAYVGGRIVGSVNAVSAQSINNVSVAPGTATALGSLPSAVAATGSAQGAGAAGTAMTAGPGAGGQSSGGTTPLATASGGGGGSALNTAAAASTAVSGSTTSTPGGAAPVAVGTTSGVSAGTVGTAAGTPVAAENGITWTYASAAGAGVSGVTGQGLSASGAAPARVAVGIALPGGSPVPTAGSIGGTGKTPGSVTATVAIGDTAASYTIASPDRLRDASGKPAAILTGGPLLPTGLPGGGLFKATPDPNGAYLVRAAGALSDNSGAADTDLLFDRTNKTERRLGDAVYEQQLVRDQILQLTGRTNLGNYADSEAQFAALVTSGVAYAQAYALTPGIALTAEQMQSLTSDIVWLEERQVDTPNGQETVLAPVVYLAAVKAHDLDNRGGIGGNLVVLNAKDGITNQGAIEGERIVGRAGNDIANTGEVTASQGVALSAGRDLNSSGIINAGSGDAVLSAGRDLTLASALETVTATVANPFAPGSVLGTFQGQQVERIASVQGQNVQLDAGGKLTLAGASVAAAQDLALTGQTVSIATVAQTALSVGGTSNGNTGGATRSDVVNFGSSLLAGDDLTVRANQDLRVTGSLVGATGAAALTSGGNVTIEAAQDLARLQFVGRSSRVSADSLSQEQTLLGSRIVAGKNLVLGAGVDANGKTIAGSNADLTILASSLRTTTPAAGESGGAISLLAARDINIGAQTESHFLDSRLSESRKGFLSSSSRSNVDVVNSSTAIGSLVSSGGTLDIVAGRDLAIVGSDLVATGDATLAAARNLSLDVSQNTRTDTHLAQRSNSGLFSGGGFSVTLGNRSQKSTEDGAAVTHTGSTVGSLTGDVTLLAGDSYRQMGSTVAAPTGNVTITASKVDIGPIFDTAQARRTFEAKQSGLTLSVGSPLITAAQTVQQMSQAAGKTSDPRMQALATAAAALNIYNNAGAIQKAAGAVADGDPAGAFSVSLSLGSSRSRSDSQSASSTAVGSSVTAGKDLTIHATNGDLTAIGSTLTAGNNASLAASGAINLLAAQSTATSQSSNSGSSASLGVGYGASTGWFVAAGASRSSGSGNGADSTWTPTSVMAGNTATLVSGNDTNLLGSTVTGRQVVADVGGNLNIQSLQDTSTYHASGGSSGFSVSLGQNGIGGSVSGGRSGIDSDYQSVATLAGIQAGDGGFQVAVAGNTDLKGAAIASTDKAVQDGKNSFSTGGTLTLSDIQNKADYAGSAWGVNLGTGVSLDGKLALQGTSAGVGKDSGDASSTTQSGISGIAGNTSVRTGDGANAIDRIFDAAKVQNEINAQVQIIQAFGQQATQAAKIFAQNNAQSSKENAAKARESADGRFEGKTEAEWNTEAQSWTGERLAAMNVVIAALGGGTGSTLSAAGKEVLRMAAIEMRQQMIEDSKKFPGICDAQGNCLDNKSGASAGVDGDRFKLGGGRVDVDVMCSSMPGLCKQAGDGTWVRESDGRIRLNELDGDGNPFPSLPKLLETHTDWVSTLGGYQGRTGEIFGMPYQPGGWIDKVVEAYAGPHDQLNSGTWYGVDGNIKTGLTEEQRQAGELQNKVNVLLATPYALSTLLPPELWQALGVAIMGAKP